jgi:outer membrane receptor protein involved in Fe transport
MTEGQQLQELLFQEHLDSGLFVNAFGQLNNVQINDIERIELIRGPGSAVYEALEGFI